NRAAGSSVVTSTTTSPRMPCGRTIWPTTSCTGLVRVDDVDAYPAAADRRDDLPQRLGGAPAPADHRAQVLGVYPHLQPLPAARVDHPDPYLVRMVDDALDQVLQRRPERAVRPAYRRRHRRSPRSVPRRRVPRQVPRQRAPRQVPRQRAPRQVPRQRAPRRPPPSWPPSWPAWSPPAP